MSTHLDVVLLDRDGTINVKAPDGDYVTEPEKVELLQGAGEAIRALNLAKVPVVVVTNQRGIALGRMSHSDLRDVHVRLRELLEQDGAVLDEVLYCPHDKGVCLCRKPGPLLLERARAHLGLRDLRQAVMIGDSMRDVVAGRRAGARTILLRGSDRDVSRPGYADVLYGGGVAESLLDAVRTLLEDR